MAECIQRSAQEVLGISRGGEGIIRRAWWWNEEVKQKVNEKQNAYFALRNSTSDEEKEVREVKYKAAKKLAKKLVTMAKNNTYERLHKKMENKEGEKDVFKLAWAREKKKREGWWS